MRISDIEIVERYSRSRVSPAVTPMQGLEVKKQCCNDSNPLSPRSRWRPFLRVLISLLPLSRQSSVFSLSFLYLPFPFTCLFPSRYPLVKILLHASTSCRLVSCNAIQCNPGMHCESDSLDNPMTSTTWRQLCTMISKLNWLYLIRKIFLTQCLGALIAYRSRTFNYWILLEMGKIRWSIMEMKNPCM